jgi:hypothetical protein
MLEKYVPYDQGTANQKNIPMHLENNILIY